LEVGNTLAFDAKNLSTVNLVDLLSKVTQSVVIHGFDFTHALEHALKESFKLGRHTNVYHFSSSSVVKYVWAHKEYQPWGHKLLPQCPQCGVLNPWACVYSEVTKGYVVECKYPFCGRNVGKERQSYHIKRPDVPVISVTRDGLWLKETVN
jgi:hypothetical protein